MNNDDKFLRFKTEIELSLSQIRKNYSDIKKNDSDNLVNFSQSEKLKSEQRKIDSETRKNDLILKFYPWVAIALPLAIAIFTYFKN
jgi:hypothetical protein